MDSMKKKLPSTRQTELLQILKTRFEKNVSRHKGLAWSIVEAKLKTNPEALWSLNEMEETEGEPDVVVLNKKSTEIIFIDCSVETPKGRRSFCYDLKALESRKEHKPQNSAVEMAADMGIEILTEEEYFQLQQLGEFDLKTSSWIKTPPEIRKLGGALYGDRRYGRTFVGHNGAESYFGARGFRGLLRV